MGQIPVSQARAVIGLLFGFRRGDKCYLASMCREFYFHRLFPIDSDGSIDRLE